MVTMPRKSKFTLQKLDLGEETTGQRISRIRKQNGLTQRELAKLIGINQALITDYERGKLRLHAEMLARFAISLGVTTDELIGLKISFQNGVKPNLKLRKKLMEIESLPIAQQRALFKTINAFLIAADK